MYLASILHGHGHVHVHVHMCMYNFTTPFTASIRRWYMAALSTYRVGALRRSSTRAATRLRWSGFWASCSCSRRQVVRVMARGALRLYPASLGRRKVRRCHIRLCWAEWHRGISVGLAQSLAHLIAEVCDEAIIDGFGACLCALSTSRCFFSVMSCN